jgi:hypothetical protein
MSLPDKLTQLERTLHTQIDEAEAELRALQICAVSTPDRLTSRSIDTKPASHWDQVMTLLQQGREREALIALVRVVQCMLDERAQKTAAVEKAPKAYVDSLFNRMAVGVQDSLRQCTSESSSRLRDKAREVQKKIADLRKFLQVELHDLETELADLQRMKADEAQTTGSVKS